MATADRSDDGDPSGVGAGVARSLARQVRSVGRLFGRADSYLARWTAKVDIGRLPRKVPTKNVRKLSDQLSMVKDVYDSWKEGSSNHHKQQAKERTVAGRLKRMSNLLFSSARHSFPPFTKSFVLGTALFSTYEVVDKRLTTSIPPDDELGEDFIRRAAQSCVAVLAGASAGACHGALFVSYEAVIERGTPRIPRFVSSPRGTIASHSLAHGTLFGTYEIMKNSILVSADTDHSRWGGVAAVAGAGAVAGVAQEMVSYYTVHFEGRGLRGGFSAAKRAPLPVLSNFLVAAPGSAVGFLAFEYSRRVASELVSDDVYGNLDSVDAGEMAT